MPDGRGKTIKGTKPRSVQFGVRIPEILKERIVERSEQTGMTMGDIAIVALETYLKAPKTFRPKPVRQSYIRRDK